MVRRQAVLVILGVLLVSGSLLAAESNWKMVVRVRGHVDASFDAEQHWSPVLGQRLLSSRDAARTGDASRAQIQTADGSVATMGPNTVVAMQQLDSGGYQLNLNKGGVRAEHKGNQPYQINTRSGVLAAQGTDFAVIYQDALPPSTPGAWHALGELAQAGDPAGLGWLAQANPDGVGVLVFEGHVLGTMLGINDPVILGPGDCLLCDGHGHLLFNPPGFGPNWLPFELRPGGDGHDHITRGAPTVVPGDSTTTTTTTTGVPPQIPPNAASNPAKPTGTGSIQINVNFNPGGR